MASQSTDAVSAPSDASPVKPGSRSPARQYVAMIAITVATAQILGVTLRAPSQFEANDISRWCTVWSLLEKGTYVIDDCPWQIKTQDKVKKKDPFWKSDDGTPAPYHFYSSKPPLLPTMIAGLLYPARKLTGVPLDSAVLQSRNERWVHKEVEGQPGKSIDVLETPDQPVKWPAYVFYFKSIVVLLNIVPLLVSLILFTRVLDRYAENDWAWFLALGAAAWGNPLASFNQTLNNHTVAAWSAFFALYAMLRIWEEGAHSARYFCLAGFFGAFCACNELPAALFGVLFFVILLVRDPRRTLAYFVPAAVVPCAAFLITQYLALGQVKPVYEEFGTEAYNYQGSTWNTPLEMDWFNLHPESYATYFFHLTFGHHGIFSLTPIFLLSLYGALRTLRQKGPLRPLGAMTLLLTTALLAFYTWNPKARNYGGSTQGLRWLFWLVPFWLLMLPAGLRPGDNRRWFRWLSLSALAVSALTVGYGLRNPWSHPWFLDMIEHMNMYTLQR